MFGILRMWFMLIIVVWIAAAVAAMVSGTMAIGRKMIGKMSHEIGEKSEGLKEKMSSVRHGYVEAKEAEEPCE